jgi:hypothetical protein
MKSILFIMLIGTSAFLAGCLNGTLSDGEFHDDLRAVFGKRKVVPVPAGYKEPQHLDKIPRLVEGVSPKASAEGNEERAVMEVLVNDDGTVRDAALLYASSESFGREAEKAVMGYRFEPGSMGGAHVRVYRRIFVTPEGVLLLN